MNIASKCFLLLALLGSTAYAGMREAGTRGGGNAVICFNDPTIPKEIRASKDGELQDAHIPKITSIQMLDIYELTLATGLGTPAKVDLQEILPGESIADFSKRLLFRISQFHSAFWLETVNTIESMPPERAIAHSYGIEQINDYDLMARIDSRNCVIGTVIHHQPNGAVTDLHFDQRLWSHPKFSAYDKYVAYLHEVVYRTNRKIYSAENSDLSRRLVGLLLRKNIEHPMLVQELSVARNEKSPKSFMELRDEFYADIMKKEAMMGFAGLVLTEMIETLGNPLSKDETVDYFKEHGQPEEAYQKVLAKDPVFLRVVQQAEMRIYNNFYETDRFKEALAKFPEADRKYVAKMTSKTFHEEFYATEMARFRKLLFEKLATQYTIFQFQVRMAPYLTEETKSYLKEKLELIKKPGDHYQACLKLLRASPNEISNAEIVGIIIDRRRILPFKPLP
jgi:hypothetical protein